ncbi:B-cell receptor CD22-like isoform X2 [Polypterus senegalus]|uniref:B-cell receptor CD22-like isoform X2 n=1 Tax=Polypterus senegalus TaxID=55291 RepID=UPI001963C1F2|nr:B-cell receptor CD22-like isoform X2 [Polypterus senegalus]
MSQHNMLFFIFLAAVSSVVDLSDMEATYRPDSICALEGSTVRINCVYKYSAGVNIQNEMWFYGTKKYDVTSDRETTVYHTNEWEVPSSYRHRVQFLGNRNKKCSINISNVSREDSGFYTFGVQKYSSGYYYWTFEPGVHVTITGLKIEATAKNVKENDPVTLRCKMNCSLYGSVFWFRNGRRLNHTSAELKIQRASYEDHGNFSCQNDNFTSPEFLLNVEYIPKNAVITVKPATCTEEMTLVTLYCKALANPPCTYSWVKENRSQVGSEEQLHITEFNRSHARSYHCEATNKYGTVKSPAINVTVNENMNCSDNKPLNIALYSLLSAAVLAGLALAVFILLRKRTKKTKQQNGDVQGRNETAISPVYEDVPNAEPAQQNKQEDEQTLNYMSVQFKSHPSKTINDKEEEKRVDNAKDIIYTAVVTK